MPVNHVCKIQVNKNMHTHTRTHPPTHTHMHIPIHKHIGYILLCIDINDLLKRKKWCNKVYFIHGIPCYFVMFDQCVYATGYIIHMNCRFHD